MFLGYSGGTNEGWLLHACTAIGLFAGIGIGQATDYFTPYTYKPVQNITDAGKTGDATVIIQGPGIGVISTASPLIIIIATIR